MSKATYKVFDDESTGVFNADRPIYGEVQKTTGEYNKYQSLVCVETR